MDIWNMLAALSLVLLILFWSRRNAVWGGLTGGAIIGLLVSSLSFFKGSGFDWNIVIKGGIVGVLVGFAAELLGMLSDRLRRSE